MRKLLLLGAIFLGMCGSAQARITYAAPGTGRSTNVPNPVASAGRALRAAGLAPLEHIARSGVELMNPDGAPVGGQWQAWANASQVPTIAGPLTFVSDPQAVWAFCEQVVAGCSSSPDFYPGDPWEVAATTRWSLYAELGHEFDWRYLTDANRQQLEELWHVWPAAWWDTDTVATENGVQGDFAAAYADCAAGNYAPTTEHAFADGPVIDTNHLQATCDLIWTIWERANSSLDLGERE